MPAIRFENVSKRFVLQHERVRALQDLLVGLVRRRNGSREEFWALREVNLDIAPGEALGIVGPNGAGKSTLLKLVARIIEPTRGRIVKSGRVGALLEVVAGFHEDLTGRENVFLSGALMGLARRELKARFDEIVAFAEMEKFIDSPVKHYSTGMYMRLGFAVAAVLEPDILLIDESLAVGDAAFQRKCLIRIAEIKQRGATILFVSHQAAQVEHLCSRALLLWDGRVCADGVPGQVLKKYEELRNEYQAARLSNRAGYALIYAAEYQVAAPTALHAGQVATIPVALRNSGAVQWDCLTSPTPHTINLAYHWLDRWGQIVTWDGERTQLPRDIAPGERITLHAQVIAPAAPGSYRLEIELVDEGVAWFSQGGVPPWAQEIQVQPRR